mgnify:FL=1
MNIAAIAAGIGGKKMQGFVKRAGALVSRQKQDKSKPGHVHSDDSNDSSNNGDGGAISQFGAGLMGGMKPELPGGRPELGQNFMDADMESFSNLTDPLSVERGGRTVARPEGVDTIVENNPVQTAGNFPPLGTPDPTPREEFDQYGKQFIS